MNFELRLCILLVFPRMWWLFCYAILAREVVKRGFYRQNSTSKGQVSSLRPFNSMLGLTEQTQYLGNLQSGAVFNPDPSYDVFKRSVGLCNGCS